MGRKSRAKREKLLFSLVENLKEALKLQNGVARNWALAGIKQSFPQFTEEEIDSIIEKIPHSEPKIKGVAFP